MKSRLMFTISLLGLLALLARPVGLAAQAPTPVRYAVTDLGGLGGTFAWASGINNNGLVEGSSHLSGDVATRAFLWRNGVMTDLGTLGGPNGNSIAWYTSPSESGEAVGYSDTTTPDPNGEDACGLGTYLICLPFRWRHGTMTPLLPLLGGNNGGAYGVNNLGQVVGWAEYRTPDPTCPSYLQEGAALWEYGTVKNLLAFPGDPDAAAFAINDSGQATGGSGNCTVGFQHALLWQGDKVMNLGNLGGSYGVNGFAINNQGQVVGVSDLPGDTTGHAFLWQKRTGMKDLGTLPGAVFSVALGINNYGQVVGWTQNSDGSFETSFLWQNGVMTDLNTLTPPDSPLYLVNPRAINDWGQIVGWAVQISTGDFHAFLATPTWGSWAITERPRVVLPENVRKLLQQQPGEHFGVGIPRPQ
jgi:probable HAF family extracellular repeat protein